MINRLILLNLIAFSAGLSVYAQDKDSLNCTLTERAQQNGWSEVVARGPYGEILWTTQDVDRWIEQNPGIKEQALQHARMNEELFGKVTVSTTEFTREIQRPDGPRNPNEEQVEEAEAKTSSVFQISLNNGINFRPDAAEIRRELLTSSIEDLAASLGVPALAGWWEKALLDQHNPEAENSVAWGLNEGPQKEWIESYLELPQSGKNQRIQEMMQEPSACLGGSDRNSKFSPNPVTRTLLCFGTTPLLHETQINQLTKTKTNGGAWIRMSQDGEMKSYFAPRLPNGLYLNPIFFNVLSSDFGDWNAQFQP